MNEATKKYSIYAIASVIIALIALFLFGSYYLGGVALILSIMAFPDISNNQKKGKFLAILGLLLASLCFIIPFVIDPIVYKFRDKAKSDYGTFLAKASVHILNESRRGMEIFHTINKRFPVNFDEIKNTNPPMVDVLYFKEPWRGIQFNFAPHNNGEGFLLSAVPVAGSGLVSASFCVTEDNIFHVSREGINILDSETCKKLELLPTDLLKDIDNLSAPSSK